MPALILGFHQLVDETGGGREGDREAALAGRQAESQGDVGLAGTAVAERDDVLPRHDVFTSGQFEDSGLFNVGMAVKSKVLLTDPIDAALGILGLAVPDAPAQSLDLPNDRGLCLHPSGIVGRQSACCLRRVLDPHCDVEPVKNGWRHDPGIDQDRSQTGTAVGERGDFSVVGSADGLKALSNQRRDVGDSLRDRFEHLPPPLAVSTFPTRTSRCRLPSSRLRMNVESTLTVIAAAAAAVVGWSAVAVPSCSPIRSVWWRNVSGLLPTSMGNTCRRTQAATR
jgi:hypothetical protein